MLSEKPEKRPEADVILSEHFQRKVVDDAIHFELVGTNSRVDFDPLVIACLPVLIDPKSNRRKAILSRRRHALHDGTQSLKWFMYFTLFLDECIRY